jgi:tetratricopeptide (TPR) repeat protein
MKNIPPHLAFLGGFILFLLFLPIQDCPADEGKEKTTPFKEAVALFEQGNTDRAIEIMKGVVATDPRNAEAYDRLGYFFLKKGQFDESLNAFNSALKVNPALRTSKTGIGLVLLKKGDIKGAETTLSEALSLNPYPASTHYSLGLVYEELDDYEKSVRHFKEGIRTFKSGKK